MTETQNDNGAVLSDMENGSEIAVPMTSDEFAEIFGESPFSKQGFRALREQVDIFIGDLVDQSAKVAKRERTDNISAVHVIRAAEQVSSGKANKAFSHMGTLGGILLGAGLSNMLTMTLDGSFTTLGVAITFGFAIVGAFLVALNIAKS